MNRKILIVDDNEVERIILSGFLEHDYELITATGGKEALEILKKEYDSVSAIVLDIVMPDMDGFEVMEKIRGDADLAKIPVIVTTGLEDFKSREKAVICGANSFITKPYSRFLLLHAVKNAINLRETSAIASSVRLDRLTGLLNREAFFLEAKKAIDSQKTGYYVLSCFDVENFKVINNLYGTEKGDEVLRYIGRSINDCIEEIGGLTCRFMADKFAILFPEKYKDSDIAVCNHTEIMKPKCLSRSIRICIGRYVVNDTSLSISEMFDRAALAGASVKGKYDTYIAEYNDSMLENLLMEQKIVSEMESALANGEFEPWLQPQYNHATGAIIGAEALVRWRKDGKLVPPYKFIPIFERNGFIYKLDQSIWRQVCILLRRWLDDGRETLPVSVNISRYDILQEDFIEKLCSLVTDYNIPVNLLRLEITESAFSESAETLIRIVKELIEFGFTIEIDDFGSGYSSLNTLKDVPASILKLDMRFLEDTTESKRGGSILESVVRMAKWLGMSVIAEGVEDKVHADYLKSIGCYYIQGYYYAKPMPVSEYEILVEKELKEPKLASVHTLDTLDSNEFWNPKSMETLIFNSYVGGASIVEYHNGKVEPVRANDRFKQEFSGIFLDGVPLDRITPENCMDEKNLKIMYGNIEKAIERKRESTCELAISGIQSRHGKIMYLRCTVRMIAWTNDRYLLYCVIQNITSQRLAEQKEYGMYAELLDNLPCGAGLYEYDGKSLHVVHLNHQYWELLGRKARKFEGINVLSTVHPDDRDIILPEIADALLQKRDAVVDVRLKAERNSYKKFHVVVRISPKTDEKYSLYAFFIPASEISLLLAEQNKSRREKNRLDFIFKNAAISVWSYNVRTGEIIQNERSRAMHGFEAVVADVPQSLIKSGFVHPDYAEDYLAMYQKLKNGARVAEGIFRVKNTNRSGYWYEQIRYAAISDQDGVPEIYFGISSDVTAECEQDNTIRQWMSLISEMQVENNSITEFNLTRDSFVRNQGNLFNGFNFSQTEPFDRYIQSWISQFVIAQDAEKVAAFLCRDKLIAMHGRGVLDGGIDYRAMINGKEIFCSLNIKFIEYPGDEDVRLIMVHSDITGRMKDEHHLAELDKRDPLTKLFNRKAFEKEVNKRLSGKDKGKNALLLINLLNLRQINRDLGHDTGDRMVKKAADTISFMLSGNDFAGRLDSGEFAVFLGGISDGKAVAKKADDILNAVNARNYDGISPCAVSGTALQSDSDNTFTSLYRAAAE